MKRRVLLALTLSVANSAAAIDETFDYSMEALVHSDVRTTEWIQERWNDTGHVNCSVSCFDHSACAVHVLPDDYRFAATLNHVIDVRDGYTVAPPTTNHVVDVDLGLGVTIHCPVGVYPDGAVFALTLPSGERVSGTIPGRVIGFVVRQDSGVRDVMRWWVGIDALRGVKERESRPADAPDVRSGSATLNSDELLALASHVKRVDSFPNPQGLATTYPLCVSPDGYALEDEPVCLASTTPERIDWSVSVTPPAAPVVARMHSAPVVNDACQIAAASGGGENLCASLTNIGLVIPPVVVADHHGEGVEAASSLVVARHGENVCFRPTVFSFDPAGTEPLRWLRSDGVTEFTPVDDGRGNFCANDFPLGMQTAFLQATDQFGQSSAARSFRVSRGPVVMVHGYGPGGPENWDEIAPPLESEGFLSARINLKRPVSFSEILPVPFYFNPQNHALGTETDAVSKLVTEARTDVWLNVMHPVWSFELPIPDLIRRIARVLAALAIIPDDEEFRRVEIASFAPVCAEDDLCATIGFDAAARLRTGGTEPSLFAQIYLTANLSIPEGSPLDEPLAGEIPLDWTWDGIGLAGIGIRWRVVFDNDHQGTALIMPYLRFKAPMFGLQLANADLVGYERDLNSFVDGTLASSGYKRLSIVGYSMGGLLAHSWANNKTMTGHVEKVITIASPGRGTETAFIGVKIAKMIIHYLGGLLGPLGQIIAYVGDSLVDTLTGPALRQMYPHSDYVRQAHANFSPGSDFDEPRQYDEVASDVQRFNYVSVDWTGGWGPTICHVHTSIPFSDPLMDFPNTDDFILPWLCNGDILVTEDSASIWTFPWVTQERIESIHTGSQNEVGAQRIMCDLDASLCTPPAAAQSMLLASAPSAGSKVRTGAIRAAAPLSPRASNPSEPLTYHTESRDAVLAPGEQLSLTIDADSTTSVGFFTLVARPESGITLTVERPSGGVLEGSPTPVGLAVQDDSPAAGAYRVTVALPITSVDPEQVFVTASFATEVLLGLRAAGRTRTESGADRIPDEDVFVNGVFLRGTAPFAHAGVDCIVRSPGGSEHALELLDDGGHVDGAAGDGFFSATAPGDWFDAEGTYLVRCVALGNTANEVVSRKVEMPIRVRDPNDIGVEAGSLAVSGAATVATPVTVEFGVYNHGARDRSFVTVQVFEQLDGGEARVIGCRSFAPLPASVTTPGAITWTPSEAGCRMLTAAVVGVPGLPRDSSGFDPRSGMRRTLRVCVADAAVAMVANAGGPYSYQTGGRRIVLDGTRSLNTTDGTQFTWSIHDDAAPGTPPIATAQGRLAVVDVPRVSSATVTLALEDGARGSASSATQLTDRSRVSDALPDEPFRDWIPPVASIVGPDEVNVGERVSFLSASTDDFGPPPVQLWRLHRVSSTGYDAIGASIETVFRRPGSYTVDLLVRDAAGFAATATHALVVHPIMPVVTRVTLPSELDSGTEAEAWVELASESAIAGEEVQVSLGYFDSSGTFVHTAASSSPTDACGVARVPVTPLGGQLGSTHVRVDVPGHGTCDVAAGTCTSPVAVYDPGGPPTLVDRSPPTIIVLSPREGAPLDACAPLEVRLIVSDEGKGVDPASVSVSLDGGALALAGDCVSDPCSATVDTGAVAPGTHVLSFLARDRGELETRLDRVLEVAASPGTLACRIATPECAGIAPGGIEQALLAHVEAAGRHEVAGALRPAANELVAFIDLTKAQRGQHIPVECADALLAEAEAIIRDRWGLDPRQL
jgi:hypothetical protein